MPARTRSQLPEAYGIGELFWYVAEAVIVADADGRIVLWNPAAERLFGYEAADVLGQNVKLIIPEEYRELHESGLAGYRASGHGAYLDAHRTLELPALRKSGEVAAVELTLSSVEGARTPGRFVLAIIRDVTDRKRAERETLERMQAEQGRLEAEAALQAQEDVLALITHDLRAPLTAIKGRVQLLQRRIRRSDVAESARMLDDTQAIESAADRMAAMVTDLLDLARLHRGEELSLERRATDLVELARQAVTDLRQATRRHALQFDSPAPEIIGFWDPVRITRVLENVLMNAVRYSPDGGSINVSAREQRDDSGAWAELEVRDEGLGIPPEDLPHIFERGRRGSNVVERIPGSGLGLWGARRIIEQHGGTIEARSDSTGTIVTICLPLG